MVITRGACVPGSALALAGSRDPARPGTRRSDERVKAQQAQPSSGLDISGDLT